MANFIRNNKAREMEMKDFILLGFLGCFKYA